MTAFEELERSDIVWASDPLSKNGRPMLILVIVVVASLEGQCVRNESGNDPIKIVVKAQYTVYVVIFNHHNGHRVGETEFVVGARLMDRDGTIEKRRRRMK